MALKSTIFKADLNVADLDRQVYGDFNLTIARHPSETDERMMLRVLAFALHAGERLEFGRGISTGDEPDLWQKDLSGNIELWIDLGTPDDSRLRKACGRADAVVVYSYGNRAVPVWWEKVSDRLARCKNLTVYSVDDQSLAQLAAISTASMKLQCTVQDGEAMFSGPEASVQVAPSVLR